MDYLPLLDYMDKGILLIIAFMFFTNYKEDRQTQKEDRQVNKVLAEAAQEQTKELIQVVNTNTAVFQDTRQMHVEMDSTLLDIKEDILFLKSVTGPSNNTDIMEVLNRIESKVDAWGKEFISEG